MTSGFGVKVSILQRQRSEGFWLTDVAYRDGKMHGNYALRPPMETMPEDEKQRYLEMLANP